MSRPVCQVDGCSHDAAITIPAAIYGVGGIRVRVCDPCAKNFLKAADGACLDARLAIARKRT